MTRHRPTKPPPRPRPQSKRCVERAQVARDELTACERKFAELDRRQAEFKYRVPLAEGKFENAVAAVVASDPNTIALVDAFNAARTRSMDLAHVLECLSGDMLPERERGALCHGPGLSLRKSIAEMLSEDPRRSPSARGALA